MSNFDEVSIASISGFINWQSHTVYLVEASAIFHDKSSFKFQKTFQIPQKKNLSSVIWALSTSKALYFCRFSFPHKNFLDFLIMCSISKKIPPVYSHHETSRSKQPFYRQKASYYCLEGYREIRFWNAIIRTTHEQHRNEAKIMQTTFMGNFFWLNLIFKFLCETKAKISWFLKKVLWGIFLSVVVPCDDGMTNKVSRDQRSNENTKKTSSSPLSQSTIMKRSD